MLDGGRDTIRAFVSLLEHVKRKMERDDDMILKSQEGGVGVEREDNILEELMEAVHSCVQDLLQTAHSSSKAMTYSSPNMAKCSSVQCIHLCIAMEPIHGIGVYWLWYSYTTDNIYSRNRLREYILSMVIRTSYM